MFSELRVGLGRWIGVQGYHALVAPALELVRADHPVLNGFSCLGGDEAVIAAAVEAHGASKVVAGLVALVAALVGLLGRIIGIEMAVQLVEQIGIRGQPGRRDRESEGDGDG
jgi:hypothetical protein